MHFKEYFRWEEPNQKTEPPKRLAVAFDDIEEEIYAQARQQTNDLLAEPLNEEENGERGGGTTPADRDGALAGLMLRILHHPFSIFAARFPINNQRKTGARAEISNRKPPEGQWVDSM